MPSSGETRRRSPLSLVGVLLASVLVGVGDGHGPEKKDCSGLHAPQYDGRDDQLEHVPRENSILLEFYGADFAPT